MKRPQLSIFSITLPTTSLVFYFSIASSIIFLSFVLIWVNISSPSNIPLPAQQTTICLEYFNTSSIVFGFTPSPLAATVPPLPAADHPANLTTRDDFIDKNNVSVTENSPSKDLSVLKLTDTSSSTPENASSSYFENEAQAVEVLQHELHDDEEEEEEEEEEDSGSRELDIIFDSNFTAVPAQQIPPAAILIDKIETNTHDDQNVPSVNTTVEQNAPLNRTHEKQTAPLANTTEEKNAPLMNKTEEQNAPILMNKTEEQNAAALSEKTVQAKSRKKKKARAASFDQMTQISSSGPLLVEEDKKIAKLGGCDFSTRGRWVEDESYPLYTSRSCPFIEEGFSCNGRLDKNFTKWRWQPQDCDIPRFDARKMLEFIRGKRLVFVGDSINKNQWQSMVCMLVGDKRNPNKPRFIRKRGGYSVVFVDYQCKVEFYPSVFLVEKVMTRVDQKQEQTSLRIDSIDHGSHRWREADILVFNTEHWWVEFKTNAGVNFFQEGEKIHPYLDVLTALRKGLMTWASWVDNYINPSKTQVFFRTSSPTHFSGGKWNLRQSCVGVSEPLLQPSGIVNEKDVIVEEVLKQMKTRVTLLNTTSLSEYRMDAHPSDIRDCSHWCLPGIPDVWNELLYLHLRVSQAVGAQNDLHVKNEDGGASESDIIIDSNFTAVPAQQIPPAAILIDKIETNTHEDQNVPSVNTTIEQNAPLNRTHEEQTAPLANPTEEQNAPLMNKTEEQNAPILMNKPEMQNAAALSEKTVQAKSRKKKKARAASFDQMTQISSSGPLLVEEDKKIAKLGGCDFSTRGRWVEDESYPLYTSRSCPFIEEGFSCNGRLDKNFTKWRWQPQDCDIPRFDARKMLEFIRGKRLVFVGDSINKNQWQSMVCMLVGDKRNPNKPRFIRKRGSYSVVFVDYQCKVEFYPSVFLVEQVMTRVDQKQEQTSLRIDSIDHGSHRWREADILVFNTEHWWVEFKTNAGVNFFQEGDKIHPYLDVLTALRKGLMTWASWVDNYINPRKTQVFFRTSSPTHFSGGKWNLRQSCVGVSEPLLQPSGIVNEKDVIVEEVLKQMKTRVTLLNTTSLSEYRMDAHPSDIRDCSHWCLPGIPDVWNELLYIHLRVSQAAGSQNDLHVKNEDGGASESDIFTNVTVVPAQSAPAATLFDKIENHNAPLVNKTKEQNEPTSLMNKTDQEQSAPISENRTDQEQTAALMNKIERESVVQNAPILMNKADQEQNPPTLMNKTTDEKNAALVEKPIKKRMAGKRKKKKSIATSFDQKSSTTQISSSGGMQDIEENKKRTTKLGGCDFSTRGRWVYDESYPLYTRRSCPFIYEGFDCQGSGRLDKNFTKWRWQPQDCEIPRFNATKMLELMRGKRLLYVGDSINRNQFESMVCMLMGDIRDPNRPRISHAKGTYSFYFVDYKFTVEFSPSVFLVEKGTKRVGQKQVQTSLRIDAIDQGSSRWRGADILVFDTEHWWTDSKTNSGKNFYQEGGKIHPYLDVHTALRKGLMTWAAWVDKSINPHKTQVFFRTSSPTHFSGGEWKSGRSCIGATEPLPKPSGMANKKDVVLEEVVKQMKTHVTLLNITSLSEYRIDAHPTAIKDCSHWCLPGLPDAWNELLFLHLLSDS
ncbi:unnamed protein product [Malus baccata var. baccata]